MNLALLIGHFPPGSFGGAELQAEGWARRLADRHRVTVVTRRDPPVQPALEERDGYRVVRLPVTSIPLLRTARDLSAIGHTLAGLTPRPDLLLCFQTFVSGWAGVRAQAQLGVPAVVWVRGEAEYLLRRSRVMRVLAPRIWTAARGVLVQSEAVRTAMLAELERVAPRACQEVAAKLDVVPNALDLPATKAPPGRSVLTVGRLIPDKGVDTVIKAVAAMGVRLAIAGDGPERTRLELLAGRLGVQACFTGFVGREQLDALYRDAGVLVLAARRGEGLPNVVLEAFAHGRPVVATPVAGVPDLVVDGVNGLLVPPDEPRALGDALVRLARDRELATRLGEAGRRTAEQFAWERVRPRLEALLERWRGT